jgi:murein DD-endopeptidase MepM/ murein hydrolase activator NlpD
MKSLENFLILICLLKPDPFIGGTQDVQVTLTIPVSGLATGPQDEARLMFYNLYVNTDPQTGETLETMEIAVERGATTPGSTFVATLPTAAFYEVGTGRFAAHLLLVTTPTASSSSGGTRRLLLNHPQRRKLLQAGATCSGVSLTKPVNVAAGDKFGPRNLMGHNFHYGVDFPVATGTPVVAAQDGTLTVRRETNKATGALKGWGYYVTITGPAGTTLYGHLKEGSAIANGPVKAGDTIAQSGNTGGSTGPHLHFEYAPSKCHPCILRTFSVPSRNRFLPIDAEAGCDTGAYYRK